MLIVLVSLISCGCSNDCQPTPDWERLYYALQQQNKMLEERLDNMQRNYQIVHPVCPACIDGYLRDQLGKCKEKLSQKITTKNCNASINIY